MSRRERLVKFVQALDPDRLLTDNARYRIVSMAHPSAPKLESLSLDDLGDQISLEHLKALAPHFVGKKLVRDHGEYDNQTGTFIREPESVGTIIDAKFDTKDRLVMVAETEPTIKGMFDVMRANNGLKPDVSVGIRMKYDKDTSKAIYNAEHLAMTTKGFIDNSHIVAIIPYDHSLKATFFDYPELTMDQTLYDMIIEQTRVTGNDTIIEPINGSLVGREDIVTVECTKLSTEGDGNKIDEKQVVESAVDKGQDGVDQMNIVNTDNGMDSTNTTPNTTTEKALSESLTNIPQSLDSTDVKIPESGKIISTESTDGMVVDAPIPTSCSTDAVHALGASGLGSIKSQPDLQLSFSVNRSSVVVPVTSIIKPGREVLKRVLGQRLSTINNQKSEKTKLVKKPTCSSSVTKPLLTTSTHPLLSFIRFSASEHSTVSMATESSAPITVPSPAVPASLQSNVVTPQLHTSQTPVGQASSSSLLASGTTGTESSVSADGVTVDLGDQITIDPYSKDQIESLSNNPDTIDGSRALVSWAEALSRAQELELRTRELEEKLKAAEAQKTELETTQQRAERVSLAQALEAHLKRDIPAEELEKNNLTIKDIEDALASIESTNKDTGLDMRNAKTIRHLIAYSANKLSDQNSGNDITAAVKKHALSRAMSRFGQSMTSQAQPGPPVSSSPLVERHTSTHTDRHHPYSLLTYSRSSRMSSSQQASSTSVSNNVSKSSPEIAKNDVYSLMSPDSAALCRDIDNFIASGRR